MKSEGAEGLLVCTPSVRCAEMDVEPSSSEDDEQFLVRAVTTADGSRTEFQNPPTPKAPDLLGVGQYDSDSSSSSSSADDLTKPEKPLGAPPRANETDPPQRSNDSKNTRKRVRFADEVGAPDEVETKVPRMQADIEAAAETKVDGEELLQADFARFEELVGLVRDREDADADLAEAEDAREEARQVLFKEKVQKMRERLKRKSSAAVEVPGSSVSVGGEQMKLKLRERSGTTYAKVKFFSSSLSAAQGSGTADEDESEDDLDLMRDWTHFNTVDEIQSAKGL